ncbi:MAG: type III-B CRISPR module-associated protein Cmr5 [Planctomycetota bacterium]|nr:MAG: type III-B CRISPR module-associated protein Cmr5 [Planctomycetota bacterium]
MTTRTESQQTLDQRRAQHAWQAIEKLDRFSNQQRDEYAREAKKLPVRIMASGLGQALAFICAKASDKKETLSQLHRDLTDWVLNGRGLKGAAPESLLQSVFRGDADFMRRATNEVLAYLQWLNRFAEAKGLGKSND